MELRQLKYFVAVAEELHFERAAQRVGIGQSPLSRAIQELEGTLGTPLFIRTTRRTRLTRAGELFLPDARRILLDVARARANVLAIAAGKRDRLRFGITESIVYPRISRLLAQTSVEDPGVDLSLIQVPAAQQVRELEAGSIDLALSPTPCRLERMHSESLSSIPLVAVLPAGHPCATGTAVNLAELLRQSFVVCHPEIREACGSLATLSSIGGVESLSMLLEMAAAGFAVGLALRAQLETTGRPDVVSLPFDDRHLKVTLYAIRCNTPPSGACSRFLERARSSAHRGG